jgi:endonuclease YncB( thermonuclease family)
MDSPTSLIRAFLGWATDALPRFTNGGEEFENEAREARIGLWADPQPVPQWGWRKSNR